MSDLIDRQAAIDKFEKELSAKFNRREMAIGFVGIKSILENLPTAEPKKGKWIKLYDGNYKCSSCWSWWSVDGNEVMGDFNYCPNCGADMRGGDAE